LTSELIYTMNKGRGAIMNRKLNRVLSILLAFSLLLSATLFANATADPSEETTTTVSGEPTTSSETTDPSGQTTTEAATATTEDTTTTPGESTTSSDETTTGNSEDSTGAPEEPDIDTAVPFDETVMVQEAVGIGLFDVMMSMFGATFRYDPSKTYGQFGIIAADSAGLGEDFPALIIEHNIGSAALLETALTDAGYTSEDAAAFIQHMAEVFAYQSMASLKAALLSDDATALIADILSESDLENLQDMVGVMLECYFDVFAEISEETSNAGMSEEHINPVLFWVLTAYLRHFAEINEIEIAPGSIAPEFFTVRNHELKENLARTAITIGFAEAQGIDIEEIEVDETMMQALLDAILPLDLADLGVMLHGILLREGTTSDDLLVASALSMLLDGALEGIDAFDIANVLRTAASYSEEELLAELNRLNGFAEEELDEDSDPTQLGETASRVLINFARYIFEGWGVIRQEVDALFVDDDDSLDYVLSWVTALYIKNLAALNAEESEPELALAKASAPVSKQTRLENRAVARQLLTEPKLDTVIENFGLDNSEIYAIIDIDRMIDSRFRGALNIDYLFENTVFQEIVATPVENAVGHLLERIADKNTNEFPITKAVMAKAGLTVVSNASAVRTMSSASSSSSNGNGGCVSTTIDIAVTGCAFVSDTLTSCSTFIDNACPTKPPTTTTKTTTTKATTTTTTTTTTTVPTITAYAINAGTVHSRGVHDDDNAIDITVTTGTPVYAIGSGTVSYKAYRGKCAHTGNDYCYLGYGAYADLSCTVASQSRTVKYAHLSAWANGLSKPAGLDKHNPRMTATDFKKLHAAGTYTLESAKSYGSASVASGSVIGYTGDTGNSSGPHLHFAITGFTTLSEYYPYLGSGVTK
jgi:hypothetical protein